MSCPFWEYYGLSNRAQRIVLDDVRQGSILGPLFLLVFDLPNRLLSISKLFADNSSFFSVAQNFLSSSIKLNEDLTKNFSVSIPVESVI